MKIVLETEESIRLVADEAGGFAFETTGAGGLSPFHLLAASLATCTYSVLHGWSHHARLPMEGLEIGVGWDIGGDPVRVTDMRMDLFWPGLPPERRDAAVRVAAQCTVHKTLEHGAHVVTAVTQPD